MKIKSFFIAFLFFSTFLMHAQDTENKFGLKVGLNVADVKYEVSNPETCFGLTSKRGFHAGIFGQYFFRPKWSLNSEFLYSQRGGQDPLEPFSVGKEIEYILQFHYLTLSALPNYHFGPLSVELGPVFGYKIGEEVSGESVENPDITTVVWDRVFDFSLAGGVKYHFKRLQVGMRYIYGFSYLTNTNIDGITVSQKKTGQNRVFQVSIGYALKKLIP